MKNFNMISNTSRKWLSVMLIVLTAFVTPANAMAFDVKELWTTVASAGTADEADAGKIVYGAGTATLSVSAPTSTRAVIRYNVVAVDGLFVASDGYSMNVRFRDNGNESRVIVRLMEYDLTTGVTITRMTFDSNNFAAASGFQAQSVGVCSLGWSFDFSKKAYFIEAELSRSSASGGPGLGIVQLGYTIC